MKKIKGNITQIRELEDSIRATNRYTEGLFTKKVKRPEQGDMPSRAFSRLLEVYLDAEFMELDWDMAFMDYLNKSIEWFTSRATVIKFWYDYRDNKAEMSVEETRINIICDVIPGFAVSLAKIRQIPVEENRNDYARKVVLPELSKRG
tara:strand:- start:299 stop:742 length:444 start_codon:yes stop_codon:yes gene_type:complete